MPHPSGGDIVGIALIVGAVAFAVFQYVTMQRSIRRRRARLEHKMREMLYEHQRRMAELRSWQRSRAPVSRVDRMAQKLRALAARSDNEHERESARARLREMGLN